MLPHDICQQSMHTYRYMLQTTCTLAIQVGSKDYTIYVAATEEIKRCFKAGGRQIPWKILVCMEASKRDTPNKRVSAGQNKCRCTT